MFHCVVLIFHQKRLAFSSHCIKLKNTGAKHSEWETDKKKHLIIISLTLVNLDVGSKFYS